MKIYKNWCNLTNSEVTHILKENFPKDVVIMQKLLNRLREFRACTLELLEIRSCSTIWSISETGEIWQIEDEEGKCFIFDDFDEYKNVEEIDSLISSFIDEKEKIPTHQIKIDNGRLFILRNKYPRFLAEFNSKTGEVSDVIYWIDQPKIDPTKIAGLMRKAGAFIRSYLIKSNKNGI